MRLYEKGFPQRPGFIKFICLKVFGGYVTSFKVVFIGSIDSIINVYLSAQEKMSYFVDIIIVFIGTDFLSVFKYRSIMVLLSKSIFVFCTCAEVCASSSVGRYRKNLRVKINYSCIGIKLCDGPAQANIIFSPRKFEVIVFVTRKIT